MSEDNSVHIGIYERILSGTKDISAQIKGDRKILYRMEGHFPNFTTEELENFGGEVISRLRKNYPLAELVVISPGERARGGILLTMLLN